MNINNMAKIKLTESKLKNIIKEAVYNALTEINYSEQNITFNDLDDMAESGEFDYEIRKISKGSKTEIHYKIKELSQKLANEYNLDKSLIRPLQAIIQDRICFINREMGSERMYGRKELDDFTKKADRDEFMGNYLKGNI